MPYNHIQTESKWINKWSKSNIYKTPTINQRDHKKYILIAFPYPSADGLHVGHPLSYTGGDIISRYYRAIGNKVLYPMGWDSFGLPTENFAKKKGLHPQDVTNNSISKFRVQVDKLGASFDWEREVTTSDSSYYKWTQWFFGILYKRGLAYKKEALVNWDPVDMTVLANEQVLPDGTAERSGAMVEQKMMSQWFFRISDYAERLLTGLDGLDWPTSTSTMQKNWIGKSVGAEVDFVVDEIDKKITVFTTRIDTLYSGTFLILAPEHSMVETLTTPEQLSQIQDYQLKTKAKSQFERTEMNKDKSGVWTGSYAINPANGCRMQIWISDFVLVNYGTGAVFADAHDERDFEMAKKFDIPLKTSIKPIGLEDDSKIKNLEGCYSGYGILYNSDQFDGLESREAMPKIIEFGEIGGWAKAKTTYRLRDWSVGRQRYWGCPIPVVYSPCKLETILVDAINCLIIENNGKLEINSELFDYLKSIPQTKIVVTNAKSDTLATIKELLDGSGFGVFSLEFYPSKENPEYYQRLIKEYSLDIKSTFYFDHNDKNILSAKTSSINTYKFVSNSQIINILKDIVSGVSLVPESDLPVLLPKDLDLSTGVIKPLSHNTQFINSASKLYGHGATREGDTMDSFVCSSWYFFRYCSGNLTDKFADISDLKNWAPVDEYIIGAEHTVLHLLYSRFFTKVLFDEGLIDFEEPFLKLRHQGMILGTDNNKMSKSKGNTINPDEIFEEYGADTLRIYEMFMGPFEQSKPWSTSSIKGVRRFVERVYKMTNLVFNKRLNIDNPKLEVALHKLTKKVSEDIVSYSFNTAVSEFMKFVNLVEEVGGITADQLKRFLIILAPFAPFVTEEMWQTQNGQVEFGIENSVHSQAYPKYDPKYLVDSEITIGVQINGKVRGEVTISPEASEEEALTLIQNKDFFLRYLEGKVVKKFIYKLGKIINVIVG